MTYEELATFIAEKMRMSHVYQPLLIKTLVSAGGTATLRQVAMAFLQEDESQINYYEDRIVRMPLHVLRGHQVVRRDADLVSLEVNKLTYQQAAALRALCERRIGEFLESRGVSPWDYRLLETDPVPTSTRYEVLKRAGGRCQLCHTDERPLQVDHIKPRSQGGTNDLDNLQALCDACNLGKSNKDSTDFRPEPQ
jgi:5-methylcytosine-specific restriction endonuclease McrA